MPADVAGFQSSTPRPSDFDQFWAATRAALAEIPSAISFEASDLRSTPTVDTFAVHYTSLENVVIFGWLCLPRGRRSLPGLVIYPGYSGSPAIPRAWAGLGFAALQISPRGHHGSDAVVRVGFPGLMTAGIERPESYIYRGIYCDAWRAVDVLLARDEVDPARIGVTGGSQGGALTLIAAAGRPEVRALAADVPFLTSIRDALSLGSSFPYEEIKDHLRLAPERRASVLDTLDHIDTLNFADQIGVPTLLSVGLRDDVCPPRTAYALFNRLSCPKEIRPYAEAGHEGGGFVHAQVKQEWLKKQLVR